MTAKTPLALFLLVFALPGQSSAQMHALDYDTPAYLDFEFGEVQVDEGDAFVLINVYRFGDFRQITRVDFATEEGTADEGNDYKPTGGTLVFQPGEGMKQISIPLVADEDKEPDEIFKVVLSNASPGSLITGDSISVLIKDAPGPISTPKLEIAAAGPGKVAVSWEGDPTYTLERATGAGLHVGSDFDQTKRHWNALRSDRRDRRGGLCLSPTRPLRSVRQ
jgi:hypothetical protein